MKRIALLMASLLLLLGPAGAQAPGATVGAAGLRVTKSVSMSGGPSAFVPKKIRGHAGLQIIWNNPTGVDHTVTSYGGGWSKNSGVAPGGSTSFTFAQPGTYKYRCTLHSSVSAGVCTGMCGKIVVR